MAAVAEAPTAEEAPAAAPAAPRASTPAGGDGTPRVTICVGDLHGQYERAVRLWANLERAVGTTTFLRATVIFLGDFNDRGPRTKDLLDWLISLKERYPEQKQVFLCGNHDLSFAAFAGCLPDVPEGFDWQETWKPLAREEEREGWYKGPGYESMHVQGRRWAGVIKEKISTKGHPYDVSTFDSGATFRSYGVPFADREALLKAMPQSHKDFLRSLVWVHEEPGVDTGDPATSYSKLIAVHAGFQEGTSAADRFSWMVKRQMTVARLEELSGRKNVYENLPEHEAANVLVVSGHHGVLDTSRRLRLIIDEGGGRDAPIAALLLPSRQIVRDTDTFAEQTDSMAAATPVEVTPEVAVAASC